MSAAEDSVFSQYVPGFTANLNLYPQQTQTRLLDAVDNDLAYPVPGEMFNADDVLPSDPEAIATRVPVTPDKFPQYARRVGAFVGFNDSAWFPIRDKVRELEDPTSKVMMSLTAGRWRAVDSMILVNALGNAMSKPDNTGTFTTNPFPSAQIIGEQDQTFKHDAETLPAPGNDYGLSVGKLIEAGKMLDEGELEGERYVAFTARQKADLLRSTPVTSKFYTEMQALNDGKLTEFLGFKLRRVSAKLVPSFVNTNTNTVRQVMAWVDRAIVYRGRPIVVARIGERQDRGYTPQAYYELEHGCVRHYDVGVVQINCAEV